MKQPTITYFGHVDDGMLKIRQRRQFDDDLRMFNGKDVEITVKIKRSKRSISQNNYYWGCVINFVRNGLVDAGYNGITIKQTHGYLKDKFLRKELVNEKTGEIMTTIGSSKELTKSEFMEYIAEIQQFAAEYLNVVIPDPGEQSEIKFE